MTIYGTYDGMKEYIGNATNNTTSIYYSHNGCITSDVFKHHPLCSSAFDSPCTSQDVGNHFKATNEGVLATTESLMAALPVPICNCCSEVTKLQIKN